MGEMREVIRSNIERYIAESKYSQKEVAEQLGVSQSSITNWIKGKNSPDVDLVIPICNLFGITVAELFSDKEFEGAKKSPSTAEAASGKLSKREQGHIQKYRLLDPYGKEAVDSILDIEYRRCTAPTKEEKPQESDEKIITILFDNQKASAGAGYELDNDRLIPWKVKYNDMTRKADFCVEVDGRSMEPMFMDGDIILVRQQPSVELSEIGLFVADGKGFVKKQGDGYMISVNRDFDDIFPEDYETVICRGRVIGVLNPNWIVEQ